MATSIKHYCNSTRTGCFSCRNETSAVSSQLICDKNLLSLSIQAITAKDKKVFIWFNTIKAQMSHCRELLHLVTSVVAQRSIFIIYKC